MGALPGCPRKQSRIYSGKASIQVFGRTGFSNEPFPTSWPLSEIVEIRVLKTWFHKAAMAVYLVIGCENVDRSGGYDNAAHLSASPGLVNAAIPRHSDWSATAACESTVSRNDQGWPGGADRGAFLPSAHPDHLGQPPTKNYFLAQTVK